MIRKIYDLETNRIIFNISKTDIGWTEEGVLFNIALSKNKILLFVYNMLSPKIRFKNNKEVKYYQTNLYWFDYVVSFSVGYF